MKKWILFDVGAARGIHPGSPEAERLASVMRHNLEFLGEQTQPLKAQDPVPSARLEAVQAELTAAYATIAALAEDLDLARVRIEHLEVQLAEHQDGVKVIYLHR